MTRMYDEEKNDIIKTVNDMFPNDYMAEEWFAKIAWQGKKSCPHCSSNDIRDARINQLKHKCRKCNYYIKPIDGTFLNISYFPWRRWAITCHLIAIYDNKITVNELKYALARCGFKINGSTPILMLRRFKTFYENQSKNKKDALFYKEFKEIRGKFIIEEPIYP